MVLPAKAQRTFLLCAFAILRPDHSAGPCVPSTRPGCRNRCLMAAPHSTQEAPHAQPPVTPPAADSLWQRHKPFFAALIVLLGLCGWIYALCLQNTGGHFVYPLDDTYIHLTMARTLAWEGVWGINPADGFASAA